MRTKKIICITLAVVLGIGIIVGTVLLLRFWQGDPVSPDPDTPDYVDPFSQK